MPATQLERGRSRRRRLVEADTRTHRTLSAQFWTAYAHELDTNWTPKPSNWADKGYYHRTLKMPDTTGRTTNAAIGEFIFAVLSVIVALLLLATWLHIVGIEQAVVRGSLCFSWMVGLTAGSNK